MRADHSTFILQRTLSEERAMTIPFSMTKDHSTFILQRMFGEEWTKEHSHFID